MTLAHSWIRRRLVALAVMQTMAWVLVWLLLIAYSLIFVAFFPFMLILLFFGGVIFIPLFAAMLVCPPLFAARIFSALRALGQGRPLPSHVRGTLLAMQLCGWVIGSVFLLPVFAGVAGAMFLSPEVPDGGIVDLVGGILAFASVGGLALAIAIVAGSLRPAIPRTQVSAIALPR